MPAYDYRAKVDVFSADDARLVIAAAAPVLPHEPSAERLADLLNGILTDVAGWAAIDGSAPKPTELRDALTKFRDNCLGLLSRMGLNGAGDPPPDLPVLTTPMQPWFQWFREGAYDLLHLAHNAKRETALAAERKLVQAGALASQIVDPAIGHRAAVEASEMHATFGNDFSDENYLTVCRIKMIEEAMQRAAPMLALLTLLADAAVEVPRDAGKSNFHRAYLDQLFIGLATIWFQTFGTVPSGFERGTQTGGPALRWHKAVLDHAHDMSGRLDDEIQAALAEAARFTDRTIADRIKRAVGRSRVITRAPKSRRNAAIPQS